MTPLLRSCQGLPKLVHEWMKLSPNKLKYCSLLADLRLYAASYGRCGGEAVLFQNVVQKTSIVGRFFFPLLA